MNTPSAYSVVVVARRSIGVFALPCYDSSLSVLTRIGPRTRRIEQDITYVGSRALSGDSVWKIASIRLLQLV